MPAKELKTPAQVANELKISVKKVREYLQKGIIQGIKVGKYWGVAGEDIQRYIQRESANRGEIDWEKRVAELLKERDDLIKQMNQKAAMDQAINPEAGERRIINGRVNFMELLNEEDDMIKLMKMNAAIDHAMNAAAWKKRPNRSRTELSELARVKSDLTLQMERNAAIDRKMLEEVLEKRRKN